MLRSLEKLVHPALQYILLSPSRYGLICLKFANKLLKLEVDCCSFRLCKVKLVYFYKVQRHGCKLQHDRSTTAFLFAQTIFKS